MFVNPIDKANEELMKSLGACEGVERRDKLIQEHLKAHRMVKASGVVYGLLKELSECGIVEAGTICRKRMAIEVTEEELKEISEVIEYIENGET